MTSPHFGIYAQSSLSDVIDALVRAIGGCYITSAELGRRINDGDCDVAIDAVMVLYPNRTNQRSSGIVPAFQFNSDGDLRANVRETNRRIRAAIEGDNAKAVTALCEWLGVNPDHPHGPVQLRKSPADLVDDLPDLVQLAMRFSALGGRAA